MKRQFDALVGTYTSELEVKRAAGSISPEDYAAQLAKIPSRVLTELIIQERRQEIRDRYEDLKDQQAEGNGKRPRPPAPPKPAPKPHAKGGQRPQGISTQGIGGIGTIGFAVEQPDPAPAAIRATLDQYISDVTRIIELFNAEAKTLGDKAVERADALAQAIGGSVDALSSGLDLFESLRGYAGVAPDAVAWLARDVALVVKAVVEASQQFKAKGLEHASLFADTADKVLGAIGSAVDVLTAAQKYKGIAPQSLDFLVTDVRLLVLKLADARRYISDEALDAATAIGSGLDEITGGIGATVEAATALGPTYRGILPSALDWLGADIRALIAKLEDVRLYVSDEALTAAGEIGSSLDDVAGGIGSFVEAAGKLGPDYRGLLPAALDWLGADIRLLVAKLEDVRRYVSEDALAAAAEVGSQLGEITGGIGSFVEAAAASRDYRGLLPASVDWLGADLRLFIAKLAEIARSVPPEGIEAAALGRAIDDIFSGIGSAIQVATDIRDYVSPASENVRALGNDLIGTVAYMSELTRTLNTDGVKRAAELSGAIGDIFTGLSSAADFGSKLADRKPIAENMASFAGDVQAALAFVPPLTTGAQTFESQAALFADATVGVRRVSARALVISPH